MKTKMAIVCCALTMQITVLPSAFASGCNVVYSFESGSDGASPQSDLSLIKGSLFGTTTYGGPETNGTVFSFDIATGQESVLSYLNASAGDRPMGGLVKVQGAFYGAGYSGGGGGYNGSIYRVNTKTGQSKSIHIFDGADGKNPDGNLTFYNGLLYGTTSLGGSGVAACNSRCGTVFSINPTTGAFNTLHTFDQADGATPNGSLVYYNGGLYGTTESGGSASGGGAGTVFRLDLSTATLTTIVDFIDEPPGQNPLAPAIISNGVLYGTTALQGGSAFMVNLANGMFTTLHTFDGNGDGHYPAGRLLLHDNALYGTTQEGGAGSAGTVFKIDLKTQAETVLCSFPAGYNGPAAGLTFTNGLLYGTSEAGGAFGYGFVFSLSP